MGQVSSTREPGEQIKSEQRKRQKKKKTCLHSVEHSHGSSQDSAEHLFVKPFGHGEQCVHQRETPEEAQGQNALRRGYKDVYDVVGTGWCDDDRQVGGRRRSIGVLLIYVVG